jgi:D-3-phosphoglycerate dehydrogenase
MKKVLITGNAHPRLEETLAAKGFHVLYQPRITYAELADLLPEMSGLVVTTRLPIDRPLLERADQLEWIGRLGSGMELIDVPFAESRNIRCVSSPEGNRQAVAEHALGILLALLNRIVASAQEVKSGGWNREKNRGVELSGKTVGIIGYGNTGSSFAKLLRCFDVKLLAFDKYKNGFGDEYVEEASLEQICAESDVISFHVPLTDETRHMGGNGFYRGLGKKPWILNTSRGPVIDLDSLIGALQGGYIAGAGLDVLENENIFAYSMEEKRQLDWLMSQPNVIITPHIAGYSHEALLKMAEVLLRKLEL